MYRNNRIRSSLNKGFTLVEMMVVAPIIVLIIGVTVFAIINLTGSALAERSTANTVNSIHEALDRIEEDVRNSAAFLAQNSVTLVSPQGVNNATGVFESISSTDGDRLILNIYMTNGNPQSSSRDLVFRPNQPNACGATVNQNTPATMNVVYFVQNATLYRRVLANSNYLTDVCAGVVPWQRPSCAAGQVGTMCVTQDEKLLEGVDPDGFVIQYYALASDTTENVYAQSPTAAMRQTSMDASPTVRVTLRSELTFSGRDVVKQGVLTVTRPGTVVR